MYIILNNKMNLDIKDMIKYRDYLDNIDFTKYKDLEFIVCPSSIFIPYFTNKNFILGSQDVSKYISGSYTGEVSNKYLKGFNVGYSLVNHYERNKYFNEDLDSVINKINNLIDVDIVPILCITDSFNLDNDIIKEIDYIYNKVSDNSKIILCYESSYAIDNNELESLDVINSNISIIKNHVINEYNPDVKIIYGGHVNKDTISSIIELNNIDGIIMGKDSINIDDIEGVLEVIYG